MAEIAKCCPFFKYERWVDNKSSLKCDGGIINFPSPAARRRFVYPLCASLDGYKMCPIYKMLEKECD